MATNGQKRISNLLLILGILVVPAIINGIWVSRARQAQATEMQAEAERTATVRRGEAKRKEEAEASYRAEMAAKETKATYELASARAAQERQRAEIRESLRRRFLAFPGEKSPTLRPTALVAFRNDQPDLPLAANLSTRLAAKKLEANPTIFTAEFASEFLRQRAVSLGPDSDFQPSDYACGVLTLDLSFKDSMLETPMRMHSTQLEIEMRWHDFERGTSELLWQTSTKGAGFNVKDAQEQALDRAFGSLDPNVTKLPARLGVEGRSQVNIQY